MDAERLRRLLEEVETLRAQNRRLGERIEQLEDENRRLREQLAEAQKLAARQAAPFRREDRAKVGADQQKRPGRKAGHVGAYRPVPPSIDETVEVPLEQCPYCGGPVDSCRRVEQIIEEIAPVRPHVVKVITYHGVCRRCGAPVHSHHPLQTSEAAGCAKVHLGPRALALAACLNKVHGLTMRTTVRVLKDLTGLRITAGGIAQALQRVARRVKSDYTALVRTIRASPAVFADETSWWVGGPRWWLWVFTTPETTVYHVDQTRGSVVVDQVLGADFSGMLVSDCLSSYDPPRCRKHKCIAHHLRAIHQALDRPGTQSKEYLWNCKLFFTAVRMLYELRPTLSEDDFATRRSGMETWCDRLLDRTVHQPGDLAVRNRLLRQRPHLLGCLYEPMAEPTNNRAERALRPAVIARKLSCGNRTERGRDCWQILASIGATCRQRTIDVVDHLARQLSLTYIG
jgi:transposase